MYCDYLILSDNLIFSAITGPVPFHPLLLQHSLSHAVVGAMRCAATLAPRPARRPAPQAEGRPSPPSDGRLSPHSRKQAFTPCPTASLHPRPEAFTPTRRPSPPTRGPTFTPTCTSSSPPPHPPCVRQPACRHQGREAEDGGGGVLDRASVRADAEREEQHAGAHQLQKQQEAARPRQGLRQALQHGPRECQRDVDRDAQGHRHQEVQAGEQGPLHQVSRSCRAVVSRAIVSRPRHRAPADLEEAQHARTHARRRPGSTAGRRDAQGFLQPCSCALAARHGAATIRLIAPSLPVAAKCSCAATALSSCCATPSELSLAGHGELASAAVRVRRLL